METPGTIFDDERPIKSVRVAGESCDVWRVGYLAPHPTVTKIVPYREAGQMAYVPWLAVYAGDTIICRVNCAAVESIGYK